VCSTTEHNSFDAGQFNFEKLVWGLQPILFNKSGPQVIVSRAPAFCQIFESIISKTPQQKTSVSISEE